MDMKNLFILIINICYAFGNFKDGVLQEYCSSSTFKPMCNEDQLVYMNNAIYGTIKVGDCISETFSESTGCKANELQYFDFECSGKQSCEIQIPVPVLTSKLQCLPKGLSPYLEASYTCLTVLQDKQTCTSPRIIEASTSKLLISSTTALKTSCGQHNSPYILQAKPGQKLNISLIDFSWEEQDQNGNDKCVSYGYILDTQNDDVITICGNNKRHSHIYTSSGHSVQILLESSRLDTNRFIIQYKAFGCPDIHVPTYGWLQKEDDRSLTVGCYGSSLTWQLTCVEHTWLGIIGNCTAPAETTLVYEEHQSKTIDDEKRQPKDKVKLKISRNHVLIMTIGCFTLICCCLVIIFGIYCTKRYQKKSNTLTEENYIEYTDYEKNMNGTAVTYRSGNPCNMNQEGGLIMLPSYTMPLHRGSCQPDVPPRNNQNGVNLGKECDSQSVQYYVLENPEDNLGHVSIRR